ncbi:helix-turn-helix domain-containing protein [Asticcacaulis sp. 201]|uniref:helix-turn-helix domain-containing protein n=1 Tax=Asticcacaulis sp. 201 TaxID=3028787 RepID=UPI002915CE9C|nr:helix-turn-helix domain-containing protein [Asticcacaulis sp. 201]MDV6331245.1 helix-turn-helix domain-containing protein [Asticcacaulis sp. 201]
MAFDDKQPNPVDVHVGTYIRVRRKFLGMSQGDLAKQINLTFQQIQKYERGTNRISASKLYQIAHVLHVPIISFFDGYSDTNAGSGGQGPAFEPAGQGFLATEEGIELAEAFPRIRSPRHRRKIVELIKSLAGED